MQIWAESGKSALPICNYSQILYQFLTFTQNLKRSLQLYLFVVPCAQMPVIFMEFSKKKWYTECMLPKRGIFTAIIHRNDKGACLSDRA